MSTKIIRRRAWICIAVLPLLAGCPQSSNCGQLLVFSETSNGTGTLTIDLSGGPANGSLLLTVAGQRYTGAPVNPGAEPTTYEFFNLPSGTFDATWEISGCTEEATPIDGPLTVTIQ